MNEDDGLLLLTLELAVPIAIEEVRTLDFEERRKLAVIASEHLTAHGDNVLYKGHRKGDTARAFAELATGLAVLSFAPGGVTFAGRHWETT